MTERHDRLGFSSLLAGLKASAEDTRFRLLALLGEEELTVSDLTDILRQSQPRISRHLKLLSDAGLIERFREGSWAFHRRVSRGPGAKLGQALLDLVDPADPVLTRDRERLAQVRAQRQAAAQSYFRKHAKHWDELRKLHISEAAVEHAIKEALAGVRIESLLDLGTGTGRMLELFGPEIDRGVGLDMNPEMLSIARANLERAGLKHCTVRKADIYNLALGRDQFDVAIVHQVLHFLDDGARAIREAARVLRPGGRLLVIDFAPHELEFLREQHAHRRLGFARETIAQWMKAAGLDFVSHRSLSPEGKVKEGLTVSLWLGRDRRRVLANSSRDVA
ncbi:MAG TPA: metalloregulator ArsR/SmtB family transcription factor [Xanthobacteraceae bacterium]|nr:metalloregulator ArsR/SmtB family transcription factor [Xanthobacteraceae bacterium]